MTSLKFFTGIFLERKPESVSNLYYNQLKKNKLNGNSNKKNLMNRKYLPILNSIHRYSARIGIASLLWSTDWSLIFLSGKVFFTNGIHLYYLRKIRMQAARYNEHRINVAQAIWRGFLEYQSALETRAFLRFEWNVWSFLPTWI